MTCSHEPDDVGTSRASLIHMVPKATSGGGGPEFVTNNLPGVIATGPVVSTTAIEDGETISEANNGGAEVVPSPILRLSRVYRLQSSYCRIRWRGLSTNRRNPMPNRTMAVSAE